MKKKLFINQQNLESSLVRGQNFLEGSILRSKEKNGYYQLIPAIKFTTCVSNPEDPLNYIGKCAALALFEQKGLEVHMHSIDYNGETYEVEEGFLGDYYDESGANDDTNSQELSETGISYDPFLIKKLNEDHKALLSIFTEIMEAASEDDYASVTDGLNVFGNRLRLHLMTEQIKFHTYLQQALADSSLTQQMNNTFQDKIKVIGQTALDFMGQYEECGWNDETKKSFVEGMEGLGKILTERITMEEELYELYLPKSAYNGAV